MNHPPSTCENRIDVHGNRRVSNYSRAEFARRILWSVASPLFRYSPRICFAWRRLLLRLFGANVGQRVHVYPTCRIYFPWQLWIGDDSAIGEEALIYNLGEVRIGNRVTISQRSHICAGTHDYTLPTMPLRKLPITIGDDAWICADAFIGPGVDVGSGAVVGARAVACKHVAAWTVVAGNPASFIKDRVLKST